MNKQICYSISIYGDNDKYYSMAQIQINNILKHNNLSIVIFLCDMHAILWSEKVYQDIESLLRPKVLFINKNNEKRLQSVPDKLVRFYACFYMSSDIFHIRDADHTFSFQEEVDIVNRWHRTNKGYLIVRSSLEHYDPVMAGLLSYRSNFGELLCRYIDRINPIYKFLIARIMQYRYDQILLSLYVYPLILKDLFVVTNGCIYKGEEYHLTSNKNLKGFSD